MVGAIVITVLVSLCVVSVFAVVFAGRRPDEGWWAWFRSSLTAWRRDELSVMDADDAESDAGGLGALYQMSEPGNAYLLPPDDLPDGLAAGLTGGLSAHRWAGEESPAPAAKRGAPPRRASRAGH